MSELRREYQAIVDRLRANETYSFVDVALECQNLADSKEPVLLTDAEIGDEFSKFFMTECTSQRELRYARAIEAACHAKQKAPVTRDVTVRIYQAPPAGVIAWADGQGNPLTNWTLLDEFTRTVTIGG